MAVGGSVLIEVIVDSTIGRNVEHEAALIAQLGTMQQPGPRLAVPVTSGLGAQFRRCGGRHNSGWSVPTGNKTSLTRSQLTCTLTTVLATAHHFQSRRDQRSLQ